MPGRAETVVTDLEAGIAQVREDNPDFEGATGSVMFYAEGQLSAYASQDLRSRFLTDLGFRIPREVDETAGERASTRR